jgi:hypothetical protein
MHYKTKCNCFPEKQRRDKRLSGKVGFSLKANLSNFKSLQFKTPAKFLDKTKSLFAGKKQLTR